MKLDSPQIPIKSLWVHLHGKSQKVLQNCIVFKKMTSNSSAQLIINDCSPKELQAFYAEGQCQQVRQELGSNQLCIKSDVYKLPYFILFLYRTFNNYQLYLSNQ